MYSEWVQGTDSDLPGHSFLALIIISHTGCSTRPQSHTRNLAIHSLLGAEGRIKAFPWLTVCLVEPRPRFIHYQSSLSTLLFKVTFTWTKEWGYVVHWEVAKHHIWSQQHSMLRPYTNWQISRRQFVVCSDWELCRHANPGLTLATSRIGLFLNNHPVF